MPVAEGRAWASPTEESKAVIQSWYRKERKAPTEPISGLVSGVRITFERFSVNHGRISPVAQSAERGSPVTPFRHNAVRLQLHALAYNLANFLRTLAHDVHGQDGRELAIHARSGHDSLRENPSERSCNRYLQSRRVRSQRRRRLNPSIADARLGDLTSDNCGCGQFLLPLLPSPIFGTYVSRP
jgi:hypothetical protein